MSPKNREDFVWIKPIAQHGAVAINLGPLRFECSQEKPLEVTAAEWECLLEKTGVLEICQAPLSSELEN